MQFEPDGRIKVLAHDAKVDIGFMRILIKQKKDFSSGSATFTTAEMEELISYLQERSAVVHSTEN